MSVTGLQLCFPAWDLKYH